MMGKTENPFNTENARTPCTAGGSIGAEDGIRTRDPHLGKVRTAVQPVHQLRIRVLQSTFCPPNTPQSTQFVERSTYAYLLLVFVMQERSEVSRRDSA
jgi:hypothetical protein